MKLAFCSGQQKCLFCKGCFCFYQSKGQQIPHSIPSQKKWAKHKKNPMNDKHLLVVFGLVLQFLYGLFFFFVPCLGFKKCSERVSTSPQSLCSVLSVTNLTSCRTQSTTNKITFNKFTLELKPTQRAQTSAYLQSWKIVQKNS